MEINFFLEIFYKTKILYSALSYTLLALLPSEYSLNANNQFNFHQQTTMLTIKSHIADIEWRCHRWVRKSAYIILYIYKSYEVHNERRAIRIRDVAVPSRSLNTEFRKADMWIPPPPPAPTVFHHPHIQE